MVNVPPLLCSTPPPIDFGEDDDDSGLQSTLNLDDGDEYSDFDLVTQTHKSEFNTKVPSLPRLTPQPELDISDYRVQPPDLNNGLLSSPSPPPLLAKKNTTGNAQQTAEAFNFEVQSSHKALTAHEYADCQQVAPQTPPPLNEIDNAIDNDDDDEEEEPNTNDNVPSLKLDSLSLYSSESVSACTLSPVADELATVESSTKAHILCHQVTLEDVSDDSDEEYSPKKPKELFIREGAEDFFAIEIVATPTLEPTANKLFNGMQEQAATPGQITESSRQLSASDKPKANVAFNFDVCQEATATTTRTVFDVTPPEDDKSAYAASEEEDDDFGDFADFAAASLPTPQPTPTTTLTAPEPIPQSDDANDDGFADFQDFVTTETATTTVAAATTQSTANVVNETINVDADNDEEDDDFGDFAEPPVVAAAIAVPPPPPPAASQLSITERVKPVLELMFPTESASAVLQPVAQKPLMHAQTLHFGAIEQANALDYQWNISEMRHSLVRALAIDSRNILFGDKWNSSMPRFAANLSFDPLKPLKPQTAAAADNTMMPSSAASCVWQTPSSSAQTLEGSDAAATQACEAETQSGTSNGQNAAIEHNAANNDQQQPDNSHSVAHIADTVGSQPLDDNDDDHVAAQLDAAAATSAFAAAATAASLPIAVSADSDGYRFDGGEQQHQQQLDLRASPSSGVGSQQPSALLDELVVSSASYALPLKETHIYTPSKSDTAVARTTTLAPVDFDYDIAAAGIVIDETVVKKEYRDVEYKPPPFGLDSPSKLSGKPLPPDEDDDFSDFQSMPAMKATAQQQLQPPRNGTPTFGEQMILCPAILLPQAIPLAKSSIEWGDSSLASINAEELARIEELFPQQLTAPQRQPQAPSISASVAQQQSAPAEDDDWSDFVSVPVPPPQQQQQQQQQHVTNHNNNNNLKKAAAKDDDWSDFVCSTPPTAAAAPQFNSGAWQAANFYNNPLSLYQQQQQPTHSNLLPKYQSYANNNNNNNANNNQSMPPQQIHIMHDFSTLPAANSNLATYQQQHHQHHQQQQQRQRLQRQQQQQQPAGQFQIGHAKVSPRISLIPDLSFVAPALPNNAGAFMSALPKPSFSAKK